MAKRTAEEAFAAYSNPQPNTATYYNGYTDPSYAAYYQYDPASAYTTAYGSYAAHAPVSAAIAAGTTNNGIPGAAATRAPPVRNQIPVGYNAGTPPIKPVTDPAAKKLMVRAAGGEVWEDPTLLEWDPNDFRLFCGDLGKEVTDDILARAFSKYSSFQKAKVIRDKFTGKTEGYGFVSFKDVDDFTKVFREMNGKYIGNRPVKLRKSTWKDRCLDVRKQKEVEEGKELLLIPQPPGRKAKRRKKPKREKNMAGVPDTAMA